LSPGAADLIARILEPDPVRRYSASEALRHPWITGEGHVEEFRGHLGYAKDSFRLSGHFHKRSGVPAEMTAPGNGTGNGLAGTVPATGTGGGGSGRHGLGIFSYLFGATGASTPGTGTHSREQSHHGSISVQKSSNEPEQQYYEKEYA
jgi:serine/threonine protein kinase